MVAIIFLIITFFVGLLLRLRGMNEYIAWILSCLVMPAFIIFDEFVLPYGGGGASMWPLPLILGGFYGVIIGGLGAGIASFYLKRKERKT
ncbi:MAG: hypothetical protein H6Q64_2259 [Firmicutes bacterium]|nr:hypothetical protein [Bacillota bacterium]